MGLVFISYRRGDSAALTGRICDRLAPIFGRRHVYYDQRSIGGGEPFPRHIDVSLRHTDVQVVVIGQQWLAITDGEGRRRLDDPTDIVRHEIEVALQRGIPIIPVLINDAAMPTVDALPASMRHLATCNAIPIAAEPYFDDAIERLIVRLKHYTAQRAHNRRLLLITRAAAVVGRLSVLLACTALLYTLATLAGELSWPSAVALSIHRSPSAALLVDGLLFVATCSSLVNLRAHRLIHPRDDIDIERLSQTASALPAPRALLSLATSSLSTVLFLVLLSLVLLQPTWCIATLPAICRPPQLVTRGLHDSNLELYFIALESDSYVLPDDPHQYSLTHMPSRQIAAVRIDQVHQGSYKIVVGVHSLQQGRYGLIIEAVRLHIDAVPPSPSPLNVWTPGAPVDYRTNPYQATYTGQSTGATLFAHYLTFPDGKVQLAPGESDQLDVAVVSRVRADVRMHLDVVYKSVVDPTLHTLALTQPFEVAFSDASNWHPYTLADDGQFTPTP